ncbi:hypothetical protein SEVIR_9G507500v4 [Setaria viridis]|uniref:Uncharacterized protein n=2 Tax=Setaria TaxID=4554 RepID=K4AB54_SETIT|nr:transcription termination factor MTERF6, chloroplastic/mitochondrial [Setaria italica]XP_034575652.1 transcription termination factor MTERF6, chloroplastic/mitochondrial-like [Setaria viridis]RCV46074.1 hypothetical protein SETIT_9G503200v2 [Setaria italica]TKV97635.1 hypothetical protein SEVIR_9G507500v2 [Setaria viridis]
MFASICRRRLFRFRQIPSAAGADPSRRPYPIDALLSHGYSSAALAGAPLPEPCPATVSNLTSCGLSPASTAARKHSIRSADRADAVRALFRSYGFTDADITEIVRRASAVFTLDPDRILRPKLDLFASLGVRPRRLSTAPILFMRSLDNHLVPCVQFLRGVLGTDADVCDAISRTPRGLLADLEKNMRPAVAALRRLGLPDEFISKLITIEMGVLMLSPDRITQIFEYLKLLDLGVTDRGFLYAFRALCCLSRETWLRKVALYQSFGVSEGELLKAFKKQPTITLFSDEIITKKLQFYLDELKLEVSDVMRHPVLMGYSLEKCIIPRCAVLSVLMREGKIEPNIKLPTALLGSAKNFSDKYVMRYAHDVPDVVKAYEGKIKFEGFR